VKFLLLGDQRGPLRKGACDKENTKRAAVQL
jgi:hypothetical protein